MHSLSKSGVFFSLEIAFPIESMQNDKKTYIISKRDAICLCTNRMISHFSKKSNASFKVRTPTS